MKKHLKISICIVVKNEADGIRQIIRSVKKFGDEIIVVDGCSTDNTFILANRESGVRVIRDHGRGRGDGVRMALEKTSGDIVVFFDGDGSHNPKDIPALCKPIMLGIADLVIGSRRTGGSFDRKMNIDSLVRSFGADVLTMLVNVRFNTNLTDILYSFRAIRKSVVPGLHLNSNGFTIEHEMVVSAIRYKKRIVEIPSRENARKWGNSKLQTWAGILMFIDLCRRLYRSST